MLKVREILEATKGKLINGNENIDIKKYEIDSRILEEDTFFIPLKGEKVDSHQFILQCVKKKASGFFIESNYKDKDEIIEKCKTINANIIIIEVMDTQKALVDLAIYNRQKHIEVPVIAITGSVGKTSTREMMASVVERKYSTLVTKKNYNSNIGLPLMMLELDKQEVCVLEAGMNHKDEMNELSLILKPDICVITNIGNAHIGILGSQENIFHEKIQITNFIKGMRKLIINEDDSYLCTLKDCNEYQVMRSSLSDVYNKKIKEDSIYFQTMIYGELTPVVINQIGNHNIQNALMAIKVGELLEISREDILEGIKNYKNFKGRLEKKYLANHVLLIDDTYNASIDSMRSGLMTVHELDGKRKIAVLGDMLELGEFATTIHTQVGEIFKNLNYDRIYTLGDLAKNINKEACKYVPYIKNFDNQKDLEQELMTNLRSGDIVYFKASNAMHFGDIIKFLEDNVK